MSEQATTATGARLGHKVTIKKLERKLPDGSKVRTHPRYSWRATYVEAGKMKQKYFKTKDKADEWKEEREEEALTHGTDSAITAAERATVMETRAELERVGLSLREAITMAVAIREKEARSCTVAEMVENVIESKRRAGRSAVYLSDMELKLGRFKDVFGKRPVATVTPREVENWLHSLGVAPASVNSYRRILVVAFNDAKRHGFTDDNPAEKVDQSKEVEGEVGTVTPDEANALLTGADEAILPALAIGLFAGLRAAELERLEWDEVRLDLGHVRVKASKAKSAKNRLVPMSDNLKKWLAPHVKDTGSVWPVNGRKLMEAAHRSAGFGPPKEVKEAEEKVKRGEKGAKALKVWPKNALRHSYATYHLAFHKDAAELALHMGHTNTSIVFAHYRLPVTYEDAAAYWGLRPESAENVVEMAEAKAG